MYMELQDSSSWKLRHLYPCPLTDFARGRSLYSVIRKCVGGGCPFYSCSWPSHGNLLPYPTNKQVVSLSICVKKADSKNCAFLT